MRTKYLASIAIATAMLISAPAMAKSDHYRDGRGKVVKVEKTKKVTKYKKVKNHRWAKGQRFDRQRARYYRDVDYRQYRRLSAPPRGYRWVRSDRDAVLVANNGLVVNVVLDLF